MAIQEDVDWRQRLNLQVSELIKLRDSLTALGPLKETIDTNELEIKLANLKIRAVMTELESILQSIG